MRVFIGIPIPNEIIKYINELQREFKKCECIAKWVNPSNIHITLKFLGETEEKNIPLIKDIIKGVCINSFVIEIILKRFGFFPNGKNPRVFFIATDKEETLKKMAYALEEKLEPLGFEREYRFKSHITLARIKSKKNIDCLIKKTYHINLNKHLILDSVILYKSILTPKGPIYEEIFKQKLRKNDNK